MKRGGIGMGFEIVETPFRVGLVGLRGPVVGKSYGPTGQKLMCDMWHELNARKIQTKGINYWAYFPRPEMFTGVELVDPSTKPASFEQLDFSLARYARALHVGPYSELPRVWSDLKAQLTAAGETTGGHGLEIYGHWQQDESKLETTVLIELGARTAS